MNNCNLFAEWEQKLSLNVMKTATEIRLDFDRIALAESGDGWNHNNHYHDYLLRHAPPHCAAALEVGCGKGEFARRLAGRCDHLLALDLSAEMIGAAREQSRGYPHIDYVQADVLAYDLPAAHFGCIASIATLHHMPLAVVLPKLRGALKPGGVLLVLDLCRDEGVADFCRNLAAIPLHQALYRIKGRSRRQTPEARAAWQAHSAADNPLSLREVRAACADLLPGARVTRHLLWRYSLVWVKPTPR